VVGAAAVAAAERGAVPVGPGHHRCRPVAESARDTLEWLRAGGADESAEPRTGKAGLDPDREKELLAAWRARQG